MLLLIKNKKLRAKKLQETVEETTTQLSNEMNEMNDSLAQGLNRIDQEYLTQQEELKKHLEKAFRDRAFQAVSKRYSVPDHPPRHYFEDREDCPTPLHT